jgi:endonuclease YncB( thermonuclease family)
VTTREVASRVRVLGIDTPETKTAGYTVGCWGPEATEFAKLSLMGQRVVVVTDPTQDGDAFSPLDIRRQVWMRSLTSIGDTVRMTHPPTDLVFDEK